MHVFNRIHLPQDKGKSMFDSFDTSGSKPLNPTQMADLIQKRMAVNLIRLQLDDLRVRQLNGDPSITDDALDLITRTQLESARREYTEALMKVLDEAIDKKKLKENLPMALAVLAQAVDIPTILAALDLDISTSAQILERVREYLRSGLPE